MSYNPDFTSTVTSEISRLSKTVFRYTGDTSPSVVGYFWDFGDGKTSNEEFPSHYWKTTGLKTVSLTAIYDDGKQYTEEKIDYIEVVENDIEDYFEYMLHQHRQKENYLNILKTSFDQYSLIANCFIEELFYSRSIDNCSADNLDYIGEILSFPRNNKTDEEYRVILKQVANIFNSYGDLTYLILYVKLYLNTVYVSVTEGVGNIHFYAYTDTEVNQTLLLQRLERIAAGGVKIILSVSTEIPLEFEDTGEPALFGISSSFSEEEDDYSLYFTGGALTEEYG